MASSCRPTLVNNHVAYNCGAASGTTTVLAGGCSELSGNPSDKIGYGVNAAIKINIPTGVNDALYIGATYSKGATTDTFRNNGAGSAFGIYGGSDSPALYGSITGSYVWDSVYNSATGIGQQLTTAYGGTIAFEHGWNAEWRTSVFGGAEVLDYNSTANAILCGKFGVGAAAGGGGAAASAATGTLTTTGCNFDYRVAGVGTRTYWTPVKDLTIGAEVHVVQSPCEPCRRHRLQPAGNRRLQAERQLRSARPERVLGHLLGSPLLLIGERIRTDAAKRIALRCMLAKTKVSVAPRQRDRTMPLPAPAVPRKHIHTRASSARRTSARTALWDVEANMTDVKTYDTERGSAGEPLHDMWVRLTLDTTFVIHGIESAMDSFPQAVCPQAVNPMKELVGVKIGAGWQAEVRQRIGGALGCTHLRELLAPMATTAMQAMGGVLRSRGNRPAAPGQGDVLREVRRDGSRAVPRDFPRTPGGARGARRPPATR